MLFSQTCADYRSLMCSAQISRRVFEVLRSESFVDAWRPTGMEASGVGDAEGCCEEENNCCTGVSVSEGEVGDLFALQKDDECYAKPFELYKRLTTVVVGRETFFDFVCCVLTEYKYIGPNQRADLALACRYRNLISIFQNFMYLPLCKCMLLAGGSFKSSLLIVLYSMDALNG